MWQLETEKKEQEKQRWENVRKRVSPKWESERRNGEKKKKKQVARQTQEKREGVTHKTVAKTWKQRQEGE